MGVTIPHAIANAGAVWREQRSEWKGAPEYLLFTSAWLLLEGVAAVDTSRPPATDVLSNSATKGTKML